MFGNFYFLWVYLLNLKCVYIVRRPESHLLIYLPLFYYLNSKNIQYLIFFSIKHIILILILNVQYLIFNISNQYLILIIALVTRILMLKRQSNYISIMSIEF